MARDYSKQTKALVATRMRLAELRAMPQFKKITMLRSLIREIPKGVPFIQADVVEEFRRRYGATIGAEARSRAWKLERVKTVYINNRPAGSIRAPCNRSFGSGQEFFNWGRPRGPARRGQDIKNHSKDSVKDSRSAIKLDQVLVLDDQPKLPKVFKIALRRMALLMKMEHISRVVLLATGSATVERTEVQRFDIDIYQGE